MSTLSSDTSIKMYKIKNETRSTLASAEQGGFHSFFFTTQLLLFDIFGGSLILHIGNFRSFFEGKIRGSACNFIGIPIGSSKQTSCPEVHVPLQRSKHRPTTKCIRHISTNVFA